MRRLLLPLLVVLVLGGLWAWSRLRPLPVDTGRVVEGPIREVVEEEGKTRVLERFVVSAPVDGRLRRVELEAGDHVTSGQILAEIDPLPLESRVAEVESEIGALRERIEGVETKKPKPEEIESAHLVEKTAQEALAVAERTLAELDAVRVNAELEEDRMQGLARQQVVTTAELDAARSAATQARQRVAAQEVRVNIARLEIAIASLRSKVLESRLSDFDWEKRVYDEQIEGLQASLRRLQDDLGRTRIPSPVAGTVLVVHRESEQSVLAGTPILDVADLAGLEVEVDFLSEDAVRMAEGMPAEIFGRAVGDQALPATVKRVRPSAFLKISSLGVEQQRVTVLLDLPDPPPGLGDAFRVEVRVILDQRPRALLVDEGALFRQDGGWAVFVVEGGRARLRLVTTGLRDGRRREVLSGLTAGEEVVLYPAETVRDGARVAPIAR